MLKHAALTERIIQACHEVSNELGVGFLESVYEKALLVALREKGLVAHAQVPLEVVFRDVVVGVFAADILVQNCVLIELKAVRALAPEHKAQILNYLRATRIEVGLLINFGTPRIDVRRYELR